MSGAKGYKFVRATFSNSLYSLSEADIEIRDVKTEQLYSVEKVALSTDGYTADITLAGDASVAGTTFLQPATIYSCEINADGYEATLEFQLPNIWSDMLVTSVDTDKNTITVYGAVRAGGQYTALAHEYKVGDTYDGNLGQLVGHTVVIGIDADNNLVSLKVNDGDEVFDYVTAKDGDSDGEFWSAKDYFETASGDKYYLSTETTSTTNATYGILANNKGVYGEIEEVVAPKNTFEYGRLILNNNGTVSAAVLWDAFDGHIIATEADGSVAKETSSNSKDFKGYTVIDGETFEYIDPATITDGDIIYYSTATKFAFVYNESVEGDLETVYKDRVVVDGDKYNYIVRDNNANIVKNARYYDLDNDKYEAVTEKWANTIDKDEPVTLYLDTKGDIVLVDATVGETVTHSKEYIITKSPKAYMNGLDQMVDMSVSDGTEVTLHIKASDITSINGAAFGNMTLSSTTNSVDGTIPNTFVFNFEDHDGKKTKVDGTVVTPNGDTTGSDADVASTVFQQGGLVDVIYNDDETKVVGLDIKLGAQVAGVQMKQDDDSTEFKGGLSSIKTVGGSLNLSDSTKVYVLTGTRLDTNVLENETEDDAAPATMKEPTDNKVKLYNYSDFDLNTRAGNYKLKAIDTVEVHGNDTKEETSTTDSAKVVGSLIRFVADGTDAKVVVIDNRGFNTKVGTDAGKGDKKEPGVIGEIGEIRGGQIFKTAETETKYLGVATNTEYQLNSDGVTQQLAHLTILTVNGSVEIDSFDAKIDSDQNAKGRIVLAELDGTGKVTKLTEGEVGLAAETAPAVDKVNWIAKEVQATPSTDTLTVKNGGNIYSIKADTDCLVVKFNGSSYSESSIGDINRDENYRGIMFYTSQKNGTDLKAKVIVATQSSNPKSYTPAADHLVASTETLYIGQTATVSLVDQYGELLLQDAAATSSATANVSISGTNDATVNTITVTAVAVGSSTITMQRGGVSKTIVITVLANP